MSNTRTQYHTYTILINSPHSAGVQMRPFVMAYSGVISISYLKYILSDAL